MTTMQEIIKEGRTRIREATASDFSDPNQLLPYANRGHIWLAQKMGKIQNAGWFQKQDEFTLPALGETTALSTFTGGASFPNSEYAATQYLEYKYPGGAWVRLRMIDQGQESDYRQRTSVTVTHNPPYYLLRHSDIVWQPVSAADRTLRHTFRWRPTPMALGDSLYTPEAYDDLVVLRMCIMALNDEGTDHPRFNTWLATREQEMYEHEGRRGSEQVSELVSDESTSRLFT